MTILQTTASETHLTLSGMDAAVSQRVQSWGQSAGLKWTVIELSSGDHPFQPMITFGGIGSLEEQLERARAISRSIAELDGHVERIKVEVQLDLASPISIADSHCYFEHHFKLELPVDTNLDALTAVIQPQGARLSRNARRKDAHGITQRFVTLRDYGHDPARAIADGQRLRHALENAGYRIIEVEAERVVFDSHRELDAGWL